MLRKQNEGGTRLILNNFRLFLLFFIKLANKLD